MLSEQGDIEVSVPASELVFIKTIIDAAIQQRFWKGKSNVLLHVLNYCRATILGSH